MEHMNAVAEALLLDAGIIADSLEMIAFTADHATTDNAEILNKIRSALCLIQKSMTRHKDACVELKMAIIAAKQKAVKMAEELRSGAPDCRNLADELMMLFVYEKGKRR